MIFPLGTTAVKIEIGFYLILLQHWGFANYSVISFLGVTGHQEDFTSGHENKFYVAENLISNQYTGVYEIYFNPVTCEIKSNVENKRICFLVKLG